MESRLDELLERADKHSSTAGTGGSSRDSKHVRLSEREEDELLRGSIVDDGGRGNMTVLRKQPPNVKNGTLKDYQLEGLNWLIRLFETNINGILADEMGLGKTIQTIAFIAYLEMVCTKKGFYLVVVPMSTLMNWMKEFAKWAPGISVFKFHGDKEFRRAFTRGEMKEKQFTVMVTSYEIVIRERAALNKIDWTLLVVDEAHRLKNENSKLFKELNQLSTRMRLLLTGTPLQNNLHELWALLNFMLPDIFTSSEDFDALFAADTEEEQSIVLSKLHKILTPFLLRRLKSDVAKSLPPKKEIILSVGMAPLQKKVYKQALLKNIEIVQGSTSEVVRLQNIAMQLRKASNHPYLFEGVEDRSLPAYGEHMIFNCGKMMLLDKLLKKLLSKGSRVLIFSQMTRVLDILEDYCEFRELEFCRIDGMTPSAEREEQIEIFNAPNSPIPLFLLTTRSGGLGINLYTADIVILYDSDWNPQMDLQAQDRAYRIGQKKPVFVYRFVTENTIDEKIVERAELKLHLDALVIQQGRLSSSEGQKASKESMLNMIRFGAEEIFRSEDAQITDEDIDVILSQGERRSELMSKRVQEKAQDALAKLRLGNTQADPMALIDEAFDDETESNKAFLQKIAANLSEREKRKRKSNSYESSDSAVFGRSSLPVMYDFQFFDRKRLRLLEEKSQRYPGLSAEEEEEKDTLLGSAFSHWSRTDYLRFVRAMEKHGKDNFRDLEGAIPGKTPEEVRRYHKVFWSRIDELGDKDRVLSLISKGEKRIERLEVIKKSLDEVFALFGPDLDQLKFKYSQTQMNKGYLPDNDRFLIRTCYQLGYGHWDETKQSVRKDCEMCFDYFMRSRTPKELQRRTDILLRLLEKKDFVCK